MSKSDSVQTRMQKFVMDNINVYDFDLERNPGTFKGFRKIIYDKFFSENERAINSKMVSEYAIFKKWIMSSTLLNIDWHNIFPLYSMVFAGSSKYNPNYDEDRQLDIFCKCLFNEVKEK